MIKLLFASVVMAVLLIFGAHLLAKGEYVNGVIILTLMIILEEVWDSGVKR